MKRKGTFSDRSQLILDELQRNGAITVEEISEHLGVSVATVRRDLETLERQGRLKRTHGGAIPLEPLLYKAFRSDSSFQEQVEKNAEEKRRIAIAAAELIQNGELIAFTPGTTTMQVTRSILPGKTVTVLTNTVNIAMELSQRPDVKILVTGGYLRPGWFSLVGQPMIKSISDVIIDRLFIGVNGVDADWGLTVWNSDEADSNAALIARAKQRILVADHSKLGVAATYCFGKMEDLILLITDTGASDEAIEPFRAKGIAIKRV